MNRFFNINPKIFSNTIWVILEKILSIFGLIYVTSLVARYIGPENFGKIVFASSIFAMLQTLAMFGLENIIFQKTAVNARKGQWFLETTRIIRNIIYFFTSSILLIYFYFNIDYLTFIFALATCIAVFFSLQDVYVIYFDALLKSKINVITNVIGLFFSLLTRYIIVELKFDIVWFCLPIVLITIIPFILRFFLYRKFKIKTNEISSYQKKIYIAHSILIGRKLVLYTLAVVVYTKVCQFFLGLKSQHDLGIYSVAVTLGTSYYFILNAIISSFMTQIYQEENELRKNDLTAILNLIVLIISISALVFILLFGDLIVDKLYGPAFFAVNNFLYLMVITCMFSGLSTVADKYIIGLKRYDYLKRKSNFLMIFCVITSFILIKFYGIYGAVFSIMMTEILSGTILNYFLDKRILLKIQMKSLFPLGLLKKKYEA